MKRCEGELSDASIQMGETPSMSGGLSMKTARSFVFPATQDQPDAKAIPHRFNSVFWQALACPVRSKTTPWRQSAQSFKLR